MPGRDVVLYSKCNGKIRKWNGGSQGLGGGANKEVMVKGSRVLVMQDKY